MKAPRRRLALALAAALCAACGPGAPPKDLPGSYGADISVLGPYSRRVNLELRPQGDATLTMSTAEGQLHSYREGRWEFRRGAVVLSLFTKALFAPSGGVKAAPQPDEVLVFEARGDGLHAVDYDRKRWNGAELTLTRGALPAP